MNEKNDTHVFQFQMLSKSNRFMIILLRENYLFIQGYRNKYARAICVNQIKKMGNFTDKF